MLFPAMSNHGLFTNGWKTRSRDLWKLLAIEHRESVQKFASLEEESRMLIYEYKMVLFYYLGFYCSIVLLVSSHWVEYRLLAHMWTWNLTDRWPRIVDGFMFRFSKRIGFKLQMSKNMLNRIRKSPPPKLQLSNSYVSLVK